MVDLDHIFVQARDKNGKRGSFSLAEISDLEFHFWARSKINRLLAPYKRLTKEWTGFTKDNVWPITKRSDFVDWLQEQDRQLPPRLKLALKSLED